MKNISSAIYVLLLCFFLEKVDAMPDNSSKSNSSHQQKLSINNNLENQAAEQLIRLKQSNSSKIKTHRKNFLSALKEIIKIRQQKIPLQKQIQKRNYEVFMLQKQKKERSYELFILQKQIKEKSYELCLLNNQLIQLNMRKKYAKQTEINSYLSIQKEKHSSK